MVAIIVNPNEYISSCTYLGYELWPKKKHKYLSEDVNIEIFIVSNISLKSLLCWDRLNDASLKQ